MKGTIQIRDVVFFYFINFLGVFHSKRSFYASHNIQIYLFSWQLPIIFTKNRSNTTYSMRLRIPSWPNLIRYLQYDLRIWLPLKKYTPFKNVWRTWGTALPTLLADLMIFCPLGPMNFKNSAYIYIYHDNIYKLKTTLVVSWIVCSAWIREIVGSCHDWVKSKIIKLAFDASLQH